MSWATSSPGMAISKKPEGASAESAAADSAPAGQRTKIVVVGLGMVGIAFM